MITPAYSPTATERILPRLALDFTTASLDARVTVSRALNTATRINSNGFIETVNANLPRFDFTPATTPVCNGLLIEETRTNLVKYSSDYTQTDWTKGQITLTTGAAQSPDGTTNATKIAANSTVAEAYIRQTVAQANSTAYTLAAFAQKGTVNFLRLRNLAVSGAPNTWFNLNTGAVGTVGTGITATITPFKDGWYRCTISGTTLASIVNNLIDIAPANTDGSSAVVGNDAINLYGVDLQPGTFITSHIPTSATVPVTRNADAVSMTGTNFSDWYNATEGAFAATIVKLSSSAGTGGIFSANNGILNRIAVRALNTGPANLIVQNSGNVEASGSAATVTAGVPANVCMTYKQNSIIFASDATSIPEDTSCNIPTVVQLLIGTESGGDRFNGHFRSLRYWPQRITNAENTAFSK